MSTSDPTPTYIDPIIPSSDPLPTGSTYPLVDINLATFGSIPSVYVINGQLDIPVLKKTLAFAGGRMRSVCGRYRFSEVDGKTDYKIEFTDSPIPFLYASLPLSSVALPDSRVVQPDISQWTYDYKTVIVTDDGLDLLRVKLTELTGEDGKVEKTLLGLTFRHIIGDADLACQFNFLLSTIYTHLLTSPDSDLSTLPLPTFTTQHLTFPTPSEKTLKDRWLIQSSAIPPDQAMEFYRRSGLVPTEPMTVSLSEKELTALKARIQSGCEEGVRISKQDALSAWYVELCRACEGGEVDRVINTINYRSFHPMSKLFPFPLQHTVGNVVQMSPLAIPINSTPSQTATLIRTQINLIKSSEQETEEWLSNAAYNYRKNSDIKGIPFFKPNPDGHEVVLNSNLRYSWLSGATFGFNMMKGEVEFHTSWSSDRFLRVFQPNPSALSETDLKDGPGAELAFHIPTTEYEKIADLIKSHRADTWASFSV